MEGLGAKLDIIFKKLFTENNLLLIDFLESILDLPKNSVKNVTFNNPNYLPSDIEGKYGQMDLKMQVDDKIINVEIQLQKKGDFTARTLYYWSKMYSDELVSGEDYDLLKQTIAINIMNYNLFDCDEPYSVFKLLETSRHELMTDKCTFLFFELRKINKNIDKNDRKKLWLQLIDAETEEEFDMLENAGVSEISSAVVKIREMSKDEQIREIARLKRKWELDEHSALSYAKREGIAEGEAKGRAEEREEMINKLRKIGWSEEKIKEFYNS